MAGLDLPLRTAPDGPQRPVGKARRSREGRGGAAGETTRSLTADPVAELLLVAAAACAVVAVFLRW
ncbi:hypothetical protein SBADM41S_04755 [Streptomyces badius]